MTKHTKIQNKRGILERGAAYVEAISVLPMLILLFLGLTDLHFATNAYMAMTHISRELALLADNCDRQGVGYLDGCMSVKADRLRVTHGISGTTAGKVDSIQQQTTVVSPITGTQLQNVKIVVSGQYIPLFNIIGPINIKATSFATINDNSAP